MTLIFISNYLTLHQIPLCEQLHNALGKDFLFVSTEPMEAERIAMGWQEDGSFPYEVNIQDPGIPQKIDEADAVLIGSADDKWIHKRLQAGKIVIRYSERILKNGRWHALSPRAIKNVVTKHTQYHRSNVHLLAASAYAAGDYALFGAYRNKSYKWGYFPDVIRYEEKQIIANKDNAVTQILWVGRLISFKHPDLAVLVADYLRKKGYTFHMNIIGEGVQEQSVRQLIREKDLDDYVCVLGFMKPAQVRRYMEKANIFLFTSDFQEGWGAVLNESMNSGCAVVASHAIGSAPFLIKDGENGLLFKNCDVSDLCIKVESLIADKSRMLNLGIRAYKTISEEWDANTAANRLIAFLRALTEGHTLPVYEDGPLSKSGYLSNHWYHS